MPSDLETLGFIDDLGNHVNDGASSAHNETHLGNGNIASLVIFDEKGDIVVVGRGVLHKLSQPGLYRLH